ncbi:MAG: SET domain-containing protein [Lysobacterales bacterium]
MILPRYHIERSTIPGAGNGLFLDEPVAGGGIITAPSHIDRIFTFTDIATRADSASLLPAAARWFEDRFTLAPEWPDECCINHAFEPTGLWHLGFVIATADLAAGTEVTVDYRHLLGPGQHEAFVDAASGQAIVGFDWPESLRRSTAALARLLG